MFVGVQAPNRPRPRNATNTPRHNCLGGHAGREGHQGRYVPSRCASVRRRGTKSLPRRARTARPAPTSTAVQWLRFGPSGHMLIFAIVRKPGLEQTSSRACAATPRAGIEPQVGFGGESARVVVRGRFARGRGRPARPSARPWRRRPSRGAAPARRSCSRAAPPARPCRPARSGRALRTSPDGSSDRTSRLSARAA